MTKATLAALWRDQTERHPEPPTPALIDAYYELDDAMAWRLDWCRVHGVVPQQQLRAGDHSRFVYNWAYTFARCRGLYDALDRALKRRNYWANTLRATYEKLLLVPQEAFPC